MRVRRIAIAALALCMTTGSAEAGAEVGPGTEQVPARQATEALLSKGRVKVTVDFRSPYSGQTGTAIAVPQDDEFAYFAFSSAANPEVFVKVLGGNDPNYIQLFAAGLTTFEYTVTFTGCGRTKTFTKQAYERVTFDDGQGFPMAACQPGSNEVTVTLPGGVPLTLVRIPAGGLALILGKPLRIV